MKVVVKRPGVQAEICEVSGISEINKLVGNVDENGNGYDHGGTDIRMFIGEGIDMYVKEDAINNFDFEANLWASDNSVIFFGTIVFAGYDENTNVESGACSLTQEQIEYCMEFIDLQSV